MNIKQKIAVAPTLAAKARPVVAGDELGSRLNQFLPGS